MNRGPQSYLEHIDEATERLITRQVELVRLAGNKDKDIGTIAVETSEIAACTTSMIRAVEDLLVISRSLKEAWVIGHVRPKEENEDMQDDQEDQLRRAAMEKMIKMLRNDP